MTENASWWCAERHADRRTFLLARNRIKAAIRSWFESQDFVEIDPGCLVVSPGSETHLHCFQTELVDPDRSTHKMYLHTSPEYACKKLLASGEAKIFTFAPVFRNAERGPLHAPEFTMLEWYRTGDAADDQYARIMRDCAEIIAIAAQTAGNSTWHWKQRTCHADHPVATTNVTEILEALFGIDLPATLDVAGEPSFGALASAARTAGSPLENGETWEDIFSNLMAEAERRYADFSAVRTPDGMECPLILDGYPAVVSPLARNTKADPRFALRFELFTAGIELANGFGEEIEAAKVACALDRQMNEKERLYGERYPTDEDFISALPSIPPGTAGCAMGFDRLIMLATGASHIDQVLWTPLSQ